jgi:hypothetical protein
VNDFAYRLFLFLRIHLTTKCRCKERGLLNLALSFYFLIFVAVTNFLNNHPMKTTASLFLAMVILFCTTAIAQVTDKINYQAVARDAGGVILPNQNISIRITIEDGSGGTPLYVETHSATTNQFGLFTIAIGNGTPVTGTYSGINWLSGNQWLKIEMDPTGGNSFVMMGESQLLSVPFANYAASGGTSYAGGTGINISSGNIVNLSNTSVTPASYGNASNVAQITVDAQGRITNAANVPILGTLPAAVFGQTLRSNGTFWVANSNLYNDGINIGIGTPVPELKLTIDNDGGIMAKGTWGSGAALVTTGAGTRMIWYPKKSAFRAGDVSGSQWDAATIGDYSVAFGSDTKASSTYCVAMGSDCQATVYGASAMGLSNQATNVASTAMGQHSTASGITSTALGYYCTASGDQSIAAGGNCVAAGTGSTAMGGAAAANGPYSTAFGFFTTAGGNYSFAEGNYSVAGGMYSVAMGDGCHADSTYSICMRGSSRAGGVGSVALGWSATALADYSVAIGKSTYSAGTGAYAIGSNVSANDDGSFVLGDYTNGVPLLSGGIKHSFGARFAGGYRLYSDSTTSVGVVVFAGGGSWNSISDRRKKENFTAIDGEDILDKVGAMPVTQWNYKSQPTTQHHIGPMAQDFYAAFHLDGTSDTTINTLDIDGINMAAIQALKKRTDELRTAVDEISAMKKEMAELKAQVESIAGKNSPGSSASRSTILDPAGK